MPVKCGSSTICFWLRNQGTNRSQLLVLHNEYLIDRINVGRLRIEILKSKIHRTKITQAELHYVGSIGIDEDLMDAANLVEGEKVTVVNINNGERLETYVIKEERGSGTVCLNGPAARKAQVGDIVIIMSYATVKFKKAKEFKPTLVFPTPDNKLP